jgi:hypothetical protein
MLLRAARRQEEIGNHERALALTERMQEVTRAWHEQLKRHTTAPRTNPSSPAIALTKDLKYISAPDWIALTEKRRARYGAAKIGGKLDRDERTKVILAQLERKLSVSFAQEIPLEEALKYIKSNTQSEELDLPSGLPIYVDPIGLQEAEKTLASTVILDVEGVAMKDALRLVLDQLALEYDVKDGLMIITSAHRPNPPKP